ncbi:hypothetical protein Nepgr_018879 [Nepenthes gracilis]|uniref:Uncharacterized protein n=1 Tax=Nepenthes gracilis TaxID=150966 RepID=A0AAD3XTV7_NEPGR|nr:hypothetical protein Nepgr_018879 [Nepenthes gracilis]
MADIMEMMAHGQRNLEPTLAIILVLVNPGVKAYDRFTNERAPKFLVNPDPTKVGAWIRKIEKIFTIICCLEVDKVAFATLKLEGEVDHWWSMQKRAFSIVED